MRLASITPHRILLKCAHKLPVLEALLFGQAGLITGNDKYATQLKEEYRFLKRKYNLIPMRAHLWKFSRTRPSNFPTIRIAQLAAVYHKSPGLFGKILETDCRKNLICLLDVNSSPYWKNHYSFGRKSAPKEKRLGRSTINILIINVFVPLIFTYARIAGNEKMLKVFLQMLKDTPPESNRITRKWAQMGFRPHNALESQALIELKNNFCDNHRCLDCEIGQQLISR